MNIETLKMKTFLAAFLFSAGFFSFCNQTIAQDVCNQFPEETMEQYTCLANNGSKEHQYRLGAIAYDKGDITLAKEWLKKASAKIPETKEAVATSRHIKAMGLLLLIKSEEKGVKYEVEKIGPNSKNISIKGNLQSHINIGCVGFGLISKDVTPADIFEGIKVCIQNDKFEEIIPMFLLANLNGRFDAKRVSDRTAGQGIRVMQMNTFGALSSVKQQELQRHLENFRNSPSEMDKFCLSARQLDYPTYHPDYMILHGINAFSGIEGNGLKGDFNSEKVWNELYTKFCEPA